MRSQLAVAGLIVVVMAFSFPFSPVGASHEARIVLPYGLDERWVPVVAGFEVVPAPLQCGTGTASGATLFAEDFSDGAAFALLPSWTFDATDVNLWHVSSIVGKGTDALHSAGGHLYFGHDATGMFETGGQRVAGAASFEIDVPAGDSPVFLAFNTKWEGEWFSGYDHMWVEVEHNDQVYILCTTNAMGRLDGSSNSDTTAGSCSPYHVGYCPNDDQLLNVAGLTRNLDDAAPHWESRYAEIPSLFAGATVQVRFTFESSDGVANAWLGWMVDDLVLTDAVTDGSPLPPLPS